MVRRDVRQRLGELVDEVLVHGGQRRHPQSLAGRKTRGQARVGSRCSFRGEIVRLSTRSLIGSFVVGVLVLGTLAIAPGSAEGAGGRRAKDRALHPSAGQLWRASTTDESRDQLAMYDGLTPLRGNVTDADIDSHYLPENFEPVGNTTEVQTGRPVCVCSTTSTA